MDGKRKTALRIPSRGQFSSGPSIGRSINLQRGDCGGPSPLGSLASLLARQHALFIRGLLGWWSVNKWTPPNRAFHERGFTSTALHRSNLVVAPLMDQDSLNGLRQGSVSMHAQLQPVVCLSLLKQITERLHRSADWPPSMHLFVYIPASCTSPPLASTSCCSHH